MSLAVLGVVIAIRELAVSGLEKKVIVKIGAPRKIDNSDDYYCPYQIVGLGNETVKRAGGVDAIQAISLAFGMIGADLYSSPEGRAQRIKWHGSPGDTLGFPVPKGLEDLKY